MKKIALVLLLAVCAFAVTNVYYSVGQNATDHKTGSPTMTMSSGLATFSIAQTSHAMGVGDRVTYNTTSIAYIASKVSQTQWNLVTKLGATPSDEASPVTVNSIAHEFTSLAAAEADWLDSDHVNNADLTAADVVVNSPLYFDGSIDQTKVTISGYTTDATRYINIYTPTDTTTECNKSQRHTGTAGTGYTINPNAAGIGIDLSDEYVRVTGIEITGWINTDASASGEGIDVNQPYCTIDACIIHDDDDQTVSADADADGISTGLNGDNLTIRNCIIYNCDRSGIRFYGCSSTTAYNISVYNCNTGQYIEDEGGGGFHVRTAVVVDAQNCICVGNVQGGNGADFGVSSGGDFGGSTDKLISSDATASTYATNNLTSKTDYSNYFTSVTSGSEDLHLKGTTDDGGIFGVTGLAGNDLSGTFTTDIDVQTRSAWDIGGDEYYANILSAAISFDVDGDSLVSQPDTNKLAHLYMFNNEAGDSGNVGGKNGTLTNGATYTTTKKFGSHSLLLDGDNDYVALGDVAMFNSATTFTISCWIYPIDQVDYIGYIVNKRLSADNNMFLNINDDGTGVVRLLIKSGGTATYGYFAATDLTLNAWNHLAAVYDGGGAANIDRIKLYLDGIKKTLTFSGTVPASMPDLSTADTRVGYSSTAFDGYVDNVSFFSDARTDAEVKHEYVATRERYQADVTDQNSWADLGATGADSLIYSSDSTTLADTFFVGATDTLLDFSALYVGHRAITYDTTTSGDTTFIDSINTANFADTITVIAANGGGQAYHALYPITINIADTTAIDTTVASGGTAGRTTKTPYSYTAYRQIGYRQKQYKQTIYK